MKVSCWPKITIYKLVSGCLFLTLFCNIFFNIKVKTIQKIFSRHTSRPEDLSSDGINNNLAYNPVQCPKQQFFISKVFDSDVKKYRLQFSGMKWMRTCCYKEILYDGYDGYRSAPCKGFTDNFTIPNSIKYGIIVESWPSSWVANFYKDAFFFFPYDERQATYPIEAKGKELDIKPNNFDIFLIGVNSLSQLDFLAKMPRTFAFFQNNNWFQLDNYYKISDDSVPNIMALLTGLNSSGIQQHCDGFYDGFLDACHFLFEKFREYGFSTAYAEDEAVYGLFQKPPIDFYVTPMIATYKKEKKIREEMEYGKFDEKTTTDCIANRVIADVIFDAATEFMQSNMKQPKFGFFSTNSMLFNDFHNASYLDEHIIAYLDKWKINGFFEKNIFIFISDHGMRWGKWRQHPETYYEEQLPALFIYLPPYIREKYPEFANALTANKNRLISPYDIYVTLQHLLSLSQNRNLTSSASVVSAESCPTCQSVLQPIEENRNCSDAGITSHWCGFTGLSHFMINTNSKIMFNITNLVVQKINAFVTHRRPYLCRKLFLKSVDNVELKAKDFKFYKEEELDLNALDPKNEGVLFRVLFTTKPGAMKYASTFLYFKNTHKIKLDIYDISAWTAYESLSICVNNSFVQRFCYCF